MASVDFATFCYYGDTERVYGKGALRALVGSHGYAFDNVIVVRQRCRDALHHPLATLQDVIEVDSEDHPDILTEFGIPEHDGKADHYTHGPTAPHYWKWHVLNHLAGLKVSQADYIVFSDNDCRMIRNAKPGWVEVGVKLLQRNRDVLVVSPSDGGKIADVGMLPGGVRLTRNNSQQLFLCERERLKKADFAIPWDWEFLAPWEPFQEYYYMLEGRIWRYMHHNNLCRALLPEKWRYWHGPGP
jgi:hypothetical protein